MWVRNTFCWALWATVTTLWLKPFKTLGFPLNKLNLRLKNAWNTAALLPSVLAYNKPVNGPRQQQIATALGRPNDDAAEAIGDLILALGMPRTLRDVGVKREHYDFIANGAMQNMMVRSNPRPITAPAQVEEILDLAW